MNKREGEREGGRGREGERMFAAAARQAFAVCVAGLFERCRVQIGEVGL